MLRLKNEGKFFLSRRCHNGQGTAIFVTFVSSWSRFYCQKQQPDDPQKKLLSFNQQQNMTSRSEYIYLFSSLSTIWVSRRCKLLYHVVKFSTCWNPIHLKNLSPLTKNTQHPKKQKNIHENHLNLLLKCSWNIKMLHIQYSFMKVTCKLKRKIR